MGSLRGRYMLDCNRIDFRFIRLQAAGRLGRLDGRQAWPVGLLQEASSVWWHGQQRQAAGSAQRLNCAHFLGGHCTKICTDARLEIMKLESLKFGKQEWESIWGSLYCVQLFFSTLIHWHFLASFWQQTGILFYLHFFLALDLRRRDSVRKTLKRRGNTVKEFSVLREFEIWYNVDFDKVEGGAKIHSQVASQHII